jgi:hypothetical protein
MANSLLIRCVWKLEILVSRDIFTGDLSTEKQPKKKSYSERSVTNYCVHRQMLSQVSTAEHKRGCTTYLPVCQLTPPDSEVLCAGLCYALKVSWVDQRELETQK